MGNLLLGTTDAFNMILLRDFLGRIPEVYMKYIQFVPLLGIALIIALLIIPIVGHIARKYDVFDLPPKLRKGRNKDDDPTRHIHSEKTALLGGLGVLIPFLVAAIVLLKPSPILTPILISSLILIVVGVLDDAFNIPAKVQFLFQLLAALIIALSVIDIPFINNPFNGFFHLDIAKFEYNILGIPGSFLFPGDLLIIPWILLFTNALKWVGGTDGLIETTSLIAFSLLFVLGIRAESPIISIISIVMAGSLFASLFYTYPPAKIFTGSTGKTMYGFLIATLALVNGAKLATSIIILALPIIDAFVVLGTRVKLHKPKSLMDLLRINDNLHIHHRLMAIGLNAKQVLLAEASLSLLMGVLAVSTTGATKFFVLLLGILLITLSILFVHSYAKKKPAPPPKKDKKSPEAKYSY